MIKVKLKGKTDDYVYDISLDGTVVNALGMNICSNTDGFNFKLPEESNNTSHLQRQNVLNGSKEVKIKLSNGTEKLCLISDLLLIDTPFEIWTSNGWRLPKSIKKISDNN